MWLVVYCRQATQGPTLHISHVFKEREKIFSEKNSWCIAKIHSEFYSWKMQEGRNVGKKANCETLCRKIVEKIDLIRWEKKRSKVTLMYLLFTGITLSRNGCAGREDAKMLGGKKWNRLDE